MRSQRRSVLFCTECGALVVANEEFEKYTNVVRILPVRCVVALFLIGRNVPRCRADILGDISVLWHCF